MTTNTRTIKINFYVDEDDSAIRKEHYSTLNDIVYKTYKYKNRVMTSLMSFDYIIKTINDNRSLKEDERKTLKDLVAESKSYNGKDGTGFSERNTPYKIHESDLPSPIRSNVTTSVHKQFKNDLLDVLKGNVSIRNYKRNTTIPFNKKTFTLKEESESNFSFTFLSIPCKTRLGRDRSGNITTLRKIQDGSVKLCDSSFYKDQGKKGDGKSKSPFYLLLVVKEVVEEKEVDENIIMGVDIGINSPLVGYIDDKTKTIIGNREELFNRRVQFDKRKRSLSSDMRHNTGGRGRKHKLKKVYAIKDKENRWTTNLNHNYSKSLIDFAIKHNCGMINIENLSDMNKGVYLSRYWGYYQLIQMIETKAKNVGIATRKVDPSYTSQACSSCGHIHEDNRPKKESWEKFECVECGHSENADINASKNIAIAHTKDFIKKVAIHKEQKKLEKEKVVLS